MIRSFVKGLKLWRFEKLDKVTNLLEGYLKI